MKIVDSQVHMYYPPTPEHPWSPDTWGKKLHRDEPFVLEDLTAEMRSAEVDRAIISPPSWDGYRHDKALEAARLYPDRFAVMGHLAINEPASREKVAGWKEPQGMLGVRIILYAPKERAWLTDGTIDWFWPAAQKANLGVMLHVPGKPAAARKILEQYPGLKLIIDHMGCRPGTKEEDAFAQIEELCDLARFPNAAVKVCALPCYSNEPYPHKKLHQYVRQAYDAFGPKRLFWASDLTRLPCSYALCKRMFTEEMKWLTIEDLEWIMGRGVCEWLGWPID